jgi:aspartyl protease family protein
MKIGMTLFLLLWSLSLWAEPTVRVLALFKDKAMFDIDGKRRLLKMGQESPEGVKLIRSNGLRAEIEVAGKRHILTPKAHIGGHYTKPKSRDFRIVRDNNGHFMAKGRINGQPVNFLVDTGATRVAMSEKTARSLNIPYIRKGRPSISQTASGLAKTYQLKLDSVSLGGIKLQNVEGSVLEGGFPQEVLLGMSFLNRLEIQNQGNVLLIRKKH